MKINEIHIASFVVQVKPEYYDQVCGWLSQRESIEIPIPDPLMKNIVAVIESQSSQGVSECLEQVNRLPGVITTHMVYHQIEEDEESKPECV